MYPIVTRPGANPRDTVSYTHLDVYKRQGYTVGVLVQCNCGRRSQLRIGGLPVGQELNAPPPRAAAPAVHREDAGSIIIVVATDAPLLPHQVERLARRATLGLARTGSTSGNGSGDIFIAFSTANPNAAAAKSPVNVSMLPNDSLDPVFEATVQATEEAIINAMVGDVYKRQRDL